MPNTALSQLADTFAGGTPSRSNPAFFGGKIPWVKSGEVKGCVDQTEESLTELGFASSSAKWIAAGSTLVAMYGANAGDVAKLNIRATANQAVLAVVARAGTDSNYLYQAVSWVAQKLVRKAQGSGQPNLNAEIIRDEKIVRFELVEQRRIAGVLYIWDDAIATAERMTALAERQQAAILQRLFANGDAATGVLGDYFIERKQWGRPGLPVYSVTLEDGLMPREQLDRRTESALADDAHALVERGDLAYNMMRMWQGALGVADQPCIVSPAYVVMQPLPNVDVRFAAAWMKSPRGLDRLWAYSHGITEDRLRLYADDFVAIPVSFPPLDRQRAIGRAHETAAQAAREARSLAGKLRRQKRGLMQKLLTGEWRVPATGNAFAPGGPATDQLEAAE